MTIRRVIGGFATVAVVVGCIVGCGDSVAKVATEPVSGTVTLNGAAVAGAIVTFQPKGKEGNAAFGTTDASGRFTMTTSTAGDGAVVGSYLVTIVKTAQPAGGGGTPANFDPDNDADVDAAYEDYGASKIEGGESEEESQDLLPAKYKDPATSGLEAEVPPGGVNNLKFELTQ